MRSICTVGDCGKPINARGLCHMHYRRVRITGEPGGVRSRKAPNGNGDNLEQILLFHGWTVTGSGCWEWCGSLHKTGYGELWDHGLQLLAHRAAFAVWKGPVPSGIHVLHECDNRPCINPDHLFLGTNADNVRDKMVKGRQARGSSQGNATLTEDEVRKMRDLLPDRTNKSLALEYGVDPSVISKIRHGRSWTHV